MNILLCIYGRPEVGTYLLNSPHTTLFYREEKEVTSNTVIENYKTLFTGHNIDVLWSTWENSDLTPYEHHITYTLRQTEYDDWNTYLDELGMPYTAQLLSNPQYKDARIGHYRQYMHKLEITKFIRENNLQYDVLILARTDIIFTPEETVSFDLTQDTCYVPEIYWGSRGIGINDHVIIGKFQYVLDAVTMNGWPDVFARIQNAYNPEDVMRQLTIGRGFNVVEFPCSIYCKYPVELK